MATSGCGRRGAKYPGGVGAATNTGARQGSCRLIHAANGCLSRPCECVLTMQSRSGLSVTAPMCDQSRVLPAHRAGHRFAANEIARALASNR